MLIVNLKHKIQSLFNSVQRFYYLRIEMGFGFFQRNGIFDEYVD